MRRYEIPLDDFLRPFMYLLIARKVKHLWTLEEFNGYDSEHMPGFFCDGDGKAAKDIMEFLRDRLDSDSIKKDVACACITEDMATGLNCVYDNGKFYSALKDIEDYGPCSGKVLQDNDFLIEFRKRLQDCGATLMWVDGYFDGTKVPGAWYYIDTYSVPDGMDDFVDPYADNPRVYSDVRSYIMSTKHRVPEYANLVYKDGVFYEGR